MRHWERVSRRHRCPICGKPDWCLTTGPVDSPDAAICARIESENCVGADGAGWLHRLRDDRRWRDRPRQRRVRIGTAAAPSIDFGATAHDCCGALAPLQRAVLAAELGVTAGSLSRLGVGWSAQHRAYTWPMTDAVGHVRGIRLRAAGGKKWAVRGGREGLFIPDGLTTDARLVLCEGATDTAAMLSIGVEAVGRPSCTGGAGIIIDLLQHWHPADVAIIADGDAPGQRGSRYLASRLVGYVPGGVRIVTPPAKDAREWVGRGATRDDVLAAIDAAPIMRLTYSVKAVAR